MAGNVSDVAMALSENPIGLPQGPPRWRSTRYTLAYLLFAGNLILFLQRVSFSMAIVCMVNHTALETRPPPSYALNLSHAVLDTTPLSLDKLTSGYTDSSVLTESLDKTEDDSNYHGSVRMSARAHSNVSERRCGRQGGQQASDGNEDGPLLWRKKTQGLLLGALYWGFMVLEIPAGYSFYLVSPRLLCGVNMLLMSLLHVLCHPAATWSPWAVFALRVTMGMCTSFVVTCTVTLWGPWSPRGERGSLMMVGFCGQQVANAAAFPLTALLCKHGFAGGWPSVFYVFGGLGLLWSVAWFLLSADSPETHKRIHPHERDYILATRGQDYASAHKLSVPWLKIATSSCVWAMASAHVTFAWSLFLFMSNLPLYMYEIMNFDIKSNGVYSMLPFLSLGAMQLTSGFALDVIIRRDVIPLLWTRRLFIATGNLVPAVCMVALSYLPCQHVGAVIALLVVAVGMNGVSFPVIMTNAFDIAPRYAASVCSVSIAMACLPGIVTPYLVAEVTKDKKREQWQIVFLITAVICVTGTVIFWVFAKTTVQSWARVEVTENDVTADDVEIQNAKIVKHGLKVKGDDTNFNGSDDIVAEMEPLRKEASRSNSAI